RRARAQGTRPRKGRARVIPSLRGTGGKLEVFAQRRRSRQKEVEWQAPERQSLSAQQAAEPPDMSKVQRSESKTHCSQYSKEHHSHNLTVLSALPLARSFPSDENATDSTTSAWPWRFILASPVPASQTRTDLS